MGKKRKGPFVLLMIGLCLMVFGLVGVQSAPDVLQYALEAPETSARQGEGTGVSTAVDDLIDRKVKVMEGLSDTLEASTIYGVKAGQDIQGEQQAVATLLAVDVGYFEVYPDFLVEGRLVGEAECKGVKDVCVVDEKLAFALFRGNDAMGQKVSIGGREYAVIGITRYARQMGQTDEYRVYVPLRAAASAGQALDTLNVAALPVRKSGATTMFQNTVSTEWMEGGSFYSLKKEAMRRTILVRMAMLAIGLFGIIRLYGWMNQRSMRRIQALREEMSRRYFRQMMWKWAGNLLLVAAGYAAITAGLYLLLAYAIEPLYTFTEWVPECIVEWSSLKSVFWGLVHEASKLVSVSTIEMKSMAFYGGFVRWGCLTMLMGALLARYSRRKSA